MLIKSTERRPPSEANLLGPADVNDVVVVSLRVRRRPDSPPLPDLTARTSLIVPITREAFADTYGALPSELESVADFAESHGLEVVESSIARRTVWASGTAAQMQNAFGVRLNRYQAAGQTYRSYDGTASVRSSVAEFVEGIYGLDNKRILQRVKLRKRERPNASADGIDSSLLRPHQVASLYDFPITSARDQTIGILEFDGGYLESDIQTYFNDIGARMPHIANVPINGNPGTASDPETVVDIDIAGSVASGALLALYWGTNTDQGLIDTISTAVHDTVYMPSVLSISYGWVESLDPSDQGKMSTVSVIFQEAAALGVTVFVASGDTGADWGQTDHRAHVSYPASDPGVTAVGGTVISNVNGLDFEENTWRGTGGGISDYFAMPKWQINAGVPESANGDGRVGRGVPDVFAYSGPYSFCVNGSYGSWFGTSLGSPMYAALVALLNQNSDPVGFLNGNVGLRKGLYNAPPDTFRDIADGVSNGSPGYTAGPGWDACTGFGSLRGGFLREALHSNPPAGVDPGRWQVFAVNRVKGEFDVYINAIGGFLPDGAMWWLAEDDAIGRLEAGTNTFFVRGSDGSQSEVVVSDALHVQRSYLTTTPDDSREDNLSALPELGPTIFSSP